MSFGIFFGKHGFLVFGSVCGLKNETTYNLVSFGDVGNDLLVGGAGNDTLYGGNGSDTIVGNRGADTFVFTGGRDVVRDFTVGEDILDVSNSDLWQLRPRELLNDYTHQRGESVIIKYDGERIVLRGVDLDDLSASDFIFS